MTAYNARPIRAAVLDLDGTLIAMDSLDELCGLAGCRQQSEELNRQYIAGISPGVANLIARVGLLNGLPLTRIRDMLAANPRLMPGAYQLFTYLKQQQIISIIISGSIMPVLQHYQQLLGADYALGPAPLIVDQTVAGFAPEHTPPERFKLRWAVELLGQLSIDFAEVVVIGDSPGEAALFERAGLAIAINPKGGVETKADLVLHNDLRPAIAAIDAYQTSRAAARQPTT